MPTEMDLEELDRIDRTIRLRIAQLDRSMDGTAVAAPAALPGPKAYDSVGMALLLWQNRLGEIAHTVKEAEAALNAGEALSRDLLKGCADLRGEGGGRAGRKAAVTFGYLFDAPRRSRRIITVRSTSPGGR